MIVDPSSMMAILNDEPEAAEFARILESVDVVRISAASVVELAVAAGRRRSEVVSDLIGDVGMDVVPFDARQAELARAAFLQYGRGSGHPARFNFGDCLTYALAKATGEPLLFKGDDFTHTDIVSARD